LAMPFASCVRPLNLRFEEVRVVDRRPGATPLIPIRALMAAMS
jgi:hypothetical protein